jgi:hypothetical protein
MPRPIRDVVRVDGTRPASARSRLPMKLRGAALVVFALAVSLVVACGHQVTPNPPTSVLSGDVVVRFRVNGNLDFNDYTYAIVVDTCGAGTPLPQALFTGFKSYSYGFFVGASYGVGQAQLFEYFVNPNSSGQILSHNIPGSASLEYFNPNNNNQGNEFEVIFPRAQLANPYGVPQPCANLPPVSVSPTPSTSSGTSPTATSTATLAPGASPSPSPGLTPNPYPTTQAQTTWYFNFFIFQGTQVLDSLGPGGATDVTYSSAFIDTNTYDDLPVYKIVGGGAVLGNPSAQLSGGEIINYP